jgi:hypothetical protein
MKILPVAAFLSFLAVLPMPYGYYMFLRLTITIIGLYCAFKVVDKESYDFWAMIGIAVLFNPIMPIFLSKLLWVPIDIILGVYFINLNKRLKNE